MDEGSLSSGVSRKNDSRVFKLLTRSIYGQVWISGRGFVMLGDWGGGVWYFEGLQSARVTKVGTIPWAYKVSKRTVVQFSVADMKLAGGTSKIDGPDVSEASPGLEAGFAGARVGAIPWR